MYIYTYISFLRFWKESEYIYIHPFSDSFLFRDVNPFALHLQLTQHLISTLLQLLKSMALLFSSLQRGGNLNPWLVSFFFFFFSESFHSPPLPLWYSSERGVYKMIVSVHNSLQNVHQVIPCLPLTCPGLRRCHFVGWEASSRHSKLEIIWAWHFVTKGECSQAFPKTPLPKERIQGMD